MLLKTIVNENKDCSELYKGACKQKDSEDFISIDLYLSEVEYDDTFLESIRQTISKYYIHSVYIHDYESSSDAGDGRDDYYKEENDEQIAIEACIIKDGKFYGVLCECFEKCSFLLLDYPETIISHPGNYGGRNYHFYRNKYFYLMAKDITK